MMRFTLKRGKWYAMMLLGDEFDASAMCSASPSPIRVDEIRPLQTGKGKFELSFFHANYPEGVQPKTYTLQSFHRGAAGMLARSTEHDPPRFLYITAITMPWLRYNFRNHQFAGDSPQQCLDRIYPNSS